MPLFPFFFFFFFFVSRPTQNRHSTRPLENWTESKRSVNEFETSFEKIRSRFVRIRGLGENLIYDKSEYERRWITFVSNPGDDCRLLLAAVHQAGN